jgi:hypothetical protein
MVQAYLLTDLEKPIASYNTVYQYAKLESEARKNTALSTQLKAISAAVYINLRHAKHQSKVYSHLHRNHIQFRRTKD